MVIDEAFGRGSKESTRYGLELFGRMNLQLLIVTPGEKIGTIERYVQHVHYVAKGADETSKIRNLSIRAYQEAKEQVIGHLSSTSLVIEETLTTND